VWKMLGMDKLLEKQGVSANVAPLMEALVVGRLVDPGSERYTKEWAEKRSALYELTGAPLRNSPNSYYRAGDTLYGLKKELEESEKALEKLRNILCVSVPVKVAGYIRMIVSHVCPGWLRVGRLAL